jgi:hypothetical protein
VGTKAKIKAVLVENGFAPKDCIHWGHFFNAGAVAIRDDRQFRFHRAKFDGVGGVDFWQVECLSEDSKFVLASLSLRVWAGQFGVVLQEGLSEPLTSS